MLDAISFGLFGKPYRNINKPQLINSINGSNCVVEVEFSIGPNNYKVVRGMKPNIFQIHRNGELFNESAHAKEFQKMLEQNILKLNHKSFHQIVVLGSSSFVPFMQLTTMQRREVIEDLLDINIFSKMNSILRERLSKTKEELTDISHKIDINRSEISLTRRRIEGVRKIHEENIKEKTDRIVEVEKEISALEEKKVALSATLGEGLQAVETEIGVQSNELGLIDGEISSLNREIKGLKKDHKFFEDNETCPTCTQEISDEIKKLKTKEIVSTAKASTNTLKEAKVKREDLFTSVTTLKNKAAEIKSVLEDIRVTQSEIDFNNKLIRDIQRELESGRATDVDVVEAQQELETLLDTKDELIDSKLAVENEQTYNKAASEMLKDTGIKTKIIKEYLPVMNQLINKHLQTMDFFVHFELDESFTETIRSRHRDKFSYGSFSEGEKQRIDLALLFTWRQVARMKNSVATNLLVLDETFDSSLDSEGIENLFKIIYSFGEDSNVFVISHKTQEMEGRFKKTLHFHKDKNFSRIK